MKYMDTLVLYYDESEELFRGYWTRTRLSDGEIIVWDDIATSYLDQILLFVRRSWTEDLDFMYEVTNDLKSHNLILVCKDF